MPFCVNYWVGRGWSLNQKSPKCTPRCVGGIQENCYTCAGGRCKQAQVRNPSFNHESQPDMIWPRSLLLEARLHRAQRQTRCPCGFRISNASSAWRWVLPQAMEGRPLPRSTLESWKASWSWIFDCEWRRRLTRENIRPSWSWASVEGELDSWPDEVASSWSHRHTNRCPRWQQLEPSKWWTTCYHSPIFQLGSLGDGPYTWALCNDACYKARLLYWSRIPALTPAMPWTALRCYLHCFQYFVTITPLFSAARDDPGLWQRNGVYR